MKTLSIDEYWMNFLSAKKLPENTPYSGECSFGTELESSNVFLQQILNGRKTVSFNALPSFEIDRESLPRVGNLYILTDYEENPHGIIETTDVRILQFKDITWSLAQFNGDADSIEEWREIYKEFFEEDADIMGYDFSENTPIVCEQFKLLYK